MVSSIIATWLLLFVICISNKVEILKSFFVSLYLVCYHATAYSPLNGVHGKREGHMTAKVFILAKRLYYGLLVSDIKTSSVPNNDVS